MPTHQQGTVKVDNITSRDRGKSDTNDLKSMYPSSPMNLGDMTPEERRAFFQEQVLDGVINDGGHTFGEHDPNYVDAPDYGDVKTGGGGLPASPFVPNPSSPADGTTNPSGQPEAPAGYGQTPSATPFEGVGSQLSPKASSQAISRQAIKDLPADRSSS